jgi:peptide-methionine (S)-S-oxide reductase
MFGFKKVAMPSPGEALPGRANPIRTAAAHFVNHRALKGPYPEGSEKAMFGLGCFWGAERKFWELGDGIHVTAVGYAGGITPNPTYDPREISYDILLKTFWESHDPTQGMRQGNDVGTQYRSGIYTFNAAQRQAAEASKAMYEPELKKKRYGAITTEITDAPEFYFAEDYHQQYLAKNPMGYCGLGGTGVSCPIGTGAKLTQGAPA